MDGQWRYLLPAPVRRLPADLAAVVVATLCTVLVVATPVVRETPLRVVVGLPFVLFLPGYALVAVLFPEAGESPAAAPSASEEGRVEDAGTGRGAGAGADASADASDGDEPTADGGRGADAGTSAVPGRDRGVDGVERVALSFGLSIAVVPLLGLLLNFTPWGIRLWPVLLTVAAFTIGCAAAAAHRRWELPPRERFRVPYRSWLRDAHAAAFDPADRVDAALNVLLAASVLLAAGSVGFALAVPTDGERFTEFYLLTEETEGELVAADYPEELTAGEPVEVVVGVGNREHESTEYEAVVQLQRVETANNETEVVERTELDRFRTSLEHGETWHHDHQVATNETGEDLRLKYLLYRGEAPAEPTADSAYRDVHLWVDVVEG